MCYKFDGKFMIKYFIVYSKDKTIELCLCFLGCVWIPLILLKTENTVVK